MNVIRSTDVEAFYARAEGYLLPREAEHNLTFGLLSYIRHDPLGHPDAIMALVEDAGALQLVALQTDSAHNLILSLAQSPNAVTALAQSLHAEGKHLGGVNGPKAESSAFADAWSKLSGRQALVNTPMRTFRLAKVNPVTDISGQLRRATPNDRALLAQWELAFMREAFPEQEHRPEDAAHAVENSLISDARERGIFVWDDGGVVSYAAYKGPTPHGIRIGPVYTPPEQRGHGYASACVAGMSQWLLDKGYQFCFLFTDLRNPTSNHIYQVIGYQPICDFTEYVFA